MHGGVDGEYQWSDESPRSYARKSRNGQQSRDHFRDTTKRRAQQMQIAGTKEQVCRVYDNSTDNNRVYNHGLYYRVLLVCTITVL